MLIRLSILIRAKLLLLSQQVAKALATVSARPPLFCMMPSNVQNGKHATMRIVRRSSVTPTPTLIPVVLCMPSSSPPFANPSNPRLSLFIAPNSIRVSPTSTPYTLHPPLYKNRPKSDFYLHFSKNYCTFAPQRSINHHCRWLRQREKAETYYLLTAFIDALCLAVLNLENSIIYCQGNATIDVCVYIHIHALCGYAISIYGVASGLLVSQ